MPFPYVTACPVSVAFTQARQAHQHVPEEGGPEVVSMFPR